jgi:hypothetical protein
LKQVVRGNVLLIQLERAAMPDAGIALARWPAANEVNVLDAIVAPIRFKETLNKAEFSNFNWC